MAQTHECIIGGVYVFDTAEVRNDWFQYLDDFVHETPEVVPEYHPHDPVRYQTGVHKVADLTAGETTGPGISFSIKATDVENDDMPNIIALLDHVGAVANVAVDGGNDQIGP